MVDKEVKKEEGVEEKSMIDKAKEAALELKAENDRKERLLDREELLKTNDMLGGTTEAGQSNEEPEKKEETPQEYAKKILAGEAEE